MALPEYAHLVNTSACNISRSLSESSFDVRLSPTNVGVSGKIMTLKIGGELRLGDSHGEIENAECNIGTLGVVVVLRQIAIVREWAFPNLPASGMGKTSPRLCPRQSLLFIEELEMFRDLHVEYRGKRKWFGTRTSQQHEWIVSVLALIGRLSIREAREAAVSHPPCGGSVRIEAVGKNARGERGETAFEWLGMFEPGLEVAGGCLDKCGRGKAFRMEAVHGRSVQVVEKGEGPVIVAERPDVDVRFAGRVLVTEQRNKIEDLTSGNGTVYDPVGFDPDFIRRAAQSIHHPLYGVTCTIHVMMPPMVRGKSFSSIIVAVILLKCTFYFNY